MDAIRRQLADSGAAFAAVFRNANLRRLQIALAGSGIGQWSYAVAVSVYAFHVDGAKTVGLLWLIRMLPSAFASPFLAMLADRMRRELVMVYADVIRAGLIGAAAACVWLDVSSVVVYVIAAAVSVVGTAFRPAEAALMPALATTPSELTAANVVSTAIESVALFAGPALAGVLLAVWSVPTAFVLTGVLFLWSAFFVVRIRSEYARPEGEAAATTVVAEALAGFKTLWTERRLRLLGGLMAAQWAVMGALEVLLVVVAIDLLDLGNAGVGYVNSAFGVGALVGGIASAVLIGIRRLSLPIVSGIVLWGIPILLIGVFVNSAFGLIMFALVGAGSIVSTVAGLTLVQRAVPGEVLGRAFGVIEMLRLSMVGIGAVITPALIDWLGTRGTLIAVGCFLPALVVLYGPPLLRIDAEATAPGALQLSLLRGIDIFSPLPLIAVEQLASRLISVEEPAGAEIIRQGDPGDRFYVVVEGEVDVSADGVPVAVLGTGQYFGEIALLRDVPRTATVTAKTPVTLYALEREDFLGAVTGHAVSSRTAEGVVGSRLAGLSTATASIRSAGV